jgi:hypothetical protein
MAVVTFAAPGNLVEPMLVTERSHCRHCHTPISRLASRPGTEPNWWHTHTGDVECRPSADVSATSIEAVS